MIDVANTVELVAKAIWDEIRDLEDRCDMEWDDMPPEHTHFVAVRAAIAAMPPKDVSVQEAARVLLGVFDNPEENAPHGFDWGAMYAEMTADHKESIAICGCHDWPSTLTVALRALSEGKA